MCETISTIMKVTSASTLFITPAVAFSALAGTGGCGGGRSLRVSVLCQRDTVLKSLAGFH